jgi:hypothetical protein
MVAVLKVFAMDCHVIPPVSGINRPRAHRSPDQWTR